MKKILVILFILISILSFSQNDTLVIKGKVTETDNITPIPFASVFIHKSTIGAISNEDGEFEFNFPKSLLNDTLIASSIGFSKFESKISDFKNIKKIKIVLSDSIFLLDEVTAIAFDYFDTKEWESRNKKTKTNYLTFATLYIENISNFVKVLNAEFGKSKGKGSFYKWKRAQIPILEKKSQIALRYFNCPYCPGDNDYTVTLIIKGHNGDYPLNDTLKQHLLENYFQGILDKTVFMGVDYTNLEKVNNIHYEKGYSNPYTGNCFGYFKNGQMGLKGAYTNGKKHGEWEYWYSNSQTKMIVNYNKGKKVGNWKYWYDNGNMRINNNYENGNLIGNNFWWYKNGNKKKAAMYKNGKFFGKIEWSKSGKVIDRFGEKIDL